MSSSSQDQQQDPRHVETRDEHEGQPGQNTVADRLQELYKLIDGIGIAMVTSRRPRDGRLVSRALCVGKRVSGVDLAFIIPTTSKMVDDIKHDPHCNAAFYRDRTGEWVSVSGIATVRSIADPEGTGSLPTAENIASFKQLVLDTWSSDIAAWFPENTDPVSSPNVSVLLVRAISATYATTPSAFTSARVLFDLGVSALTGHVQPTAQVSMHGLGEADMAAARVLESHETGTKVVKEVKEEIKAALVRGIRETQQQVQKVEE